MEILLNQSSSFPGARLRLFNFSKLHSFKISEFQNGRGVFRGAESSWIVARTQDPWKRTSTLCFPLTALLAPCSTLLPSPTALLARRLLQFSILVCVHSQAFLPAHSSVQPQLVARNRTDRALKMPPKRKRKSTVQVAKEGGVEGAGKMRRVGAADDSVQAPAWFEEMYHGKRHVCASSSRHPGLLVPHE